MQPCSTGCTSDTQTATTNLVDKKLHLRDESESDKEENLAQKKLL